MKDIVNDECKANKGKPLVAIRCITYNHEPYIRDALEGFVMQETDFPFVAIVHDDASTDGTANIIREYAEKYPDIIKPIFETENQYSKKDGSLGRIMNDAISATGAKYVAMCEGDDYWTDPLKLQKQVDFLESNPDYGMCFTNSEILCNLKLSSFKTYKESGKINIIDLIIGGGGLCPTASILLRSEIVKDFQNEVPPLPVGDYPLQVFSAYRSNVYYMNITTCVYRFGNEGSWTRTKRKSVNYKNKIGNSTLLCDVLDEVTKGQYHSVFKSVKLLRCFKIYLQYKKYSSAFKCIGGFKNPKIVYKYYFYLRKLHISQ